MTSLFELKCSDAVSWVERLRRAEEVCEGKPITVIEL